MTEELRELWRFRELFFSMIQRELRIRYKNSVLGILWSFVNPLITTLVMWLVFGQLLANGIDSFFAYVLAALLPFTFFQSAILDSSQSILASLPVVKKIYLPRELLPLSIILSNFIHLLTGFAVFFLALLIIYATTGFGVNPFQATTWMLPILLLISLFFATGVGLLVCALNTFYEDVKYVANVVMYLLTFLCPIVYFHEQVADASLRANPWLYRLYMMNPQAVLSICYRKALLAPVHVKVLRGDVPVELDASPFPWPWLAYTAVVSVLTLWYGYRTFNRMKWRFVERP
jgi:lipopolysaccharide transport system permease protein